jgi:2-polyprenyl-3-methyl-5-hydroxy-6-metoxy-1,4-benzoquinol methylase
MMPISTKRREIVELEKMADRCVQSHVPQPQATRQGIDPDRQFDKTSLRATAHGKWVHRDYGAHFFRWGFAGRFVTSDTDVLDVGCGPDVPMIDVLTMPRSQVPRSYLGVDMNREPRKHPTRQWASFRWQFDFTSGYASLGQFDLITNFEVIEHMRKADGERLLVAMRACLRDGDSRILLSTPVFNGKAAANHIHEWTVAELSESAARCGLTVVDRFGTFASWNDVRKVCTEAERKLLDEVGRFYGGEVLACFLAPKYPDASRNNTWVLKKV